MNIFVTDYDPVICASHHCDRHEAKMILESAQILCAVHHRYGSTFPNIYKETHKNHPCTLWAGECKGNYYWLVDLFDSLNSQRMARGKAMHKSYDTLYPHIIEAPHALPMHPNSPNEWPLRLTPFAQAMPDEFKHEDATVAYKRYLLAKRDEWRTRGLDFIYKDRPIPEWVSP